MADIENRRLWELQRLLLELQQIARIISSAPYAEGSAPIDPEAVDAIDYAVRLNQRHLRAASDPEEVADIERLIELTRFFQHALEADVSSVRGDWATRQEMKRRLGRLHKDSRRLVQFSQPESDSPQRTSFVEPPYSAITDLEWSG